MAISFMDKIRLKDEQIIEKYSPILLNKYDLDGFDGIVNEMGKLRSEGYYAGLINSHMLGKLFDEGISIVEIDKINSRAKRHGELLGYQPLNLPPFTRVISSHDLQSFYNFLLGIYYNNLGRKLNKKEMIDIADILSIHIIKTRDKFDQTTKKQEITEDYFRKLRKIKWGKNSRSLCLDVGELCSYAGFPRKKTPAKFTIEQYLLDQFLAACSAVNNNRDKINQEDVIVTFKTYFKLLKTDLPTLVDKLGGENEI